MLGPRIEFKVSPQYDYIMWVYMTAFYYKAGEGRVSYYPDLAHIGFVQPYLILTEWYNE